MKVDTYYRILIDDDKNNGEPLRDKIGRIKHCDMCDYELEKEIE